MPPSPLIAVAIDSSFVRIDKGMIETLLPRIAATLVEIPLSAACNIFY
jgi:hypothetical protein